MQKSIVAIILLSLVLIAGCSVQSTENTEETHTDCPFENVNCEYPGECGRYIDKDGNEICDHSEL